MAGFPEPGSASVNINPASFAGWVGDGVTDDSIAWQAAVNMASPLNGTVSPPKGTVSAIASTVTLKQNVVIDGLNGTTIKNTSAGSAVFNTIATTPNVVIRGVTFDLNGSGAAFQIANATSISFQHIHWLIENCQFINSGTSHPAQGGISCGHAAREFVIRNNFFTTGGITTASGQIGLYALYNQFNGADIGIINVGATNSFAIGNLCNAGSNASSMPGTIAAGTAIGNQISGCTCTTTGSLTIDMITANVSMGNSVSTCTAPSSLTTAFVGGVGLSGTNPVCQGNSVAGVTGSGTGVTSAAVDARNAVGATIMANNLSGSDEIIDFDGGHDIIISGNICTGSADACIRGISLPSPCNILVENNKISGGSGEAILIAATAASAGVTVIGNQIDGQSSGFLGLISIGTCTDVLVQGNSCVNIPAGQTVPVINFASITRGIIKGNYIQTSQTFTGSGADAISLDASTSGVLYSGNVATAPTATTAWTFLDSGTNDKTDTSNFTFIGTTWTAV